MEVPPEPVLYQEPVPLVRRQPRVLQLTAVVLPESAPRGQQNLHHHVRVLYHVRDYVLEHPVVAHPPRPLLLPLARPRGSPLVMLLWLMLLLAQSAWALDPPQTRPIGLPRGVPLVMLRGLSSFGGKLA